MVVQVKAPLRKMVKVKCAICGNEYMKRKDSVARWSGNCNHCARAIAASTPERKEISRRALEKVKNAPGYIEKLSKAKTSKVDELCNRWKGGKPKCIDCGATLSTYKSVRCAPCESNRRIGTVCPVETRRKISLAQQGEKGNNWQGGKSTMRDIVHHSLEYAIWRQSVFTRDQYTCQECGASGDSLQAHHVKAYSEYPELRFCIENGLTLCLDCHKKTDNYGHKQASRTRTKRAVGA